MNPDRHVTLDEVPRVSDPALRPLAEKLAGGQWLSHDDGMTLYASRDVWGIGRMADALRRRLHGRATFYNRNRHINYTNVCALSCRFCSFYRKRGEAGAYEMPVEQVVATAREAHDAGATEVHVVGGLHPWLKFDYYLDLLRGVRTACPTLHVKAFTAIEIVHFSRIARLSIPQVLAALREAGLGSLPGGGAEIFDDRVHDEAFRGKVRADKWFEVHRAAHDAGLFSNATMLYGHIETPAERVGHLLKLRDAQAESLARGGAYFNCLIPLSFVPDGSELGALSGPTGLTDLKTLAITRLLVPNVTNVKAFWVMQTVPLSQVSLDWGVNDLDGTVVWYDITHREGDGTTHQEMHVETIRRLIREAGYDPIERDTLYRPVTRERTHRPAATGLQGRRGTLQPV